MRSTALRAASRRIGWSLLIVGAALFGSAGTGAAATTACELAAATTPFADVALLTSWNQHMADLGPRPTASRAHRAFLAWLRGQLRRVPGASVRTDGFKIRRQLERDARLALTTPDGRTLALAPSGPIPYARLTGRKGVRAPVVYVPPGQPIDAAGVAGRIVVRDHVPSGVPYAVVEALADYIHDPAGTLLPDALYERDYLGYQAILADLRAVAAAGAAGLVIVHEFPRAQVAGQYQPYEGVFWGIPALYLGVDEGTILKQVLAASPALEATLTVTGTRRTATTQNVVMTIPGASAERIVVATHTDGMNAIWDNGWVAMLALAHHLAALPPECRPRTIEMAFTSAHLYLSQHGAARYARALPCEAVAFAVALEHLGAREYVAVPRMDGPGRTLVSTGLPEFTGLFVSPRPLLLEAAIATVQAHDVRHMGVLRFQEGLVSGEGASYHLRGIPTVATIAGPWTLYDPAFGMEAVDVPLLRAQTLAVRDMILQLQDRPREEIAGGTACVDLPEGAR